MNRNRRATCCCLAFLLAALSYGADEYPINERPMYGGVEKSRKQLKVDQEFIERVIKDGRTTRAEAANYFARRGWFDFQNGEKPSAIRRFNQAWLLDPENQLALWGFAGISVDRRNLKDAIRFFEMAVSKGPEQRSLLAQYVHALVRYARETPEEPDNR